MTLRTFYLYLFGISFKITFTLSFGNIVIVLELEREKSCTLRMTRMDKIEQRDGVTFQRLTFQTKRVI